MCHADRAGGRGLRRAPLRLVDNPEDGCGALACGRLFGWEAFVWRARHTVGDANPLQVVISSMSGVTTRRIASALALRGSCRLPGRPTIN